MKAKSSVVQNGTAATSAKQPTATSSKPTAASPTFVDKAIKEIDNFEGLLLALVKLGFILVSVLLNFLRSQVTTFHNKLERLTVSSLV